MALSGNRLGTSIFNAVRAISIPVDSEITDATLEAIWQAVGNAITSEIASNATVSTSNTGQATGVQAGGGVAPTTGTGTGTIS